jgi:hypothetical protein
MPVFVGRLAAEALVVVVSILLAFQLEEWRDQRRAAELEKAQLSAIRDDLLENQVRLDTILARQRNVVQSSQILAAVHDGALPSPSSDSLAILLFRASQWWRFEPVTAAYDAMVSSGDVTRLRSRPLIQELASFSGDLDPEFEDQVESMDLLGEMRRIQMQYGLAAFPRGFRENRGLEGDASREAMAELIRDPRLAYLVALRGALESGRLQLYERLEEGMNRMLELLDRELTQRGAT